MLHDVERRSSHGCDEVAVGPQGREPAFERGEFPTEVMACSSFGESHEFVDAVLRVAVDEEVDVVGHGLQLQQFVAGFGADLVDDLPEPFVHGARIPFDGWVVELGVEAGDYLASVFGAPYDVVVTAVCHVVVVFHLVCPSHVQ